MVDKELELLRKLGNCDDKEQMSRAIEEFEAAKARAEQTKVYVILYQDLWLNTCKVSQEGYKTLSEAQAFCEKRLGMDVKPNNPAVRVVVSDNQFVYREYSNGVTKEKYTIVEVTI